MLQAFDSVVYSIGKYTCCTTGKLTCYSTGSCLLNYSLLYCNVPLGNIFWYIYPGLLTDHQRGLRSDKIYFIGYWLWAQWERAIYPIWLLCSNKHLEWNSYNHCAADSKLITEVLNHSITAKYVYSLNEITKLLASLITLPSIYIIVL